MCPRNCLRKRPNPVAGKSKKVGGHTVRGRILEAPVLQLATSPPLGENGEVTEHPRYVDID